MVEISSAVTAVLSVKCEQTDIHYMLTVTMPDDSTMGNDSEKVASVTLHLEQLTSDNTGGETAVCLVDTKTAAVV